MQDHELTARGIGNRLIGEKVPEASSTELLLGTDDSWESHMSSAPTLSDPQKESAAQVFGALTKGLPHLQVNELVLGLQLHLDPRITEDAVLTSLAVCGVEMQHGALRLQGFLDWLAHFFREFEPAQVDAGISSLAGVRLTSLEMLE